MTININVKKQNKQTMDFRVKRSIGLDFRNKLSYGTANSNRLFNALLRVLEKYPEVIDEIKEYQRLND